MKSTYLSSNATAATRRREQRTQAARNTARQATATPDAHSSVGVWGSTSWQSVIKSLSASFELHATVPQSQGPRVQRFKDTVTIGWCGDYFAML